MFTPKKLQIFSLLIFCLFFVSVAWAGSQLSIINTQKNYEPAPCTDDSETYEETEEGNDDESYDENSSGDMQDDSGSDESE